MSPKHTSPPCICRYHCSTRMPLSIFPQARTTLLMVSPFTCTPPTKEVQPPSFWDPLMPLVQTALRGLSLPVPICREHNVDSGVRPWRRAQGSSSPAFRKTHHGPHGCIRLREEGDPGVFPSGKTIQGNIIFVSSASSRGWPESTAFSGDRVKRQRHSRTGPEMEQEREGYGTGALRPLDDTPCNQAASYSLLWVPSVTWPQKDCVDNTNVLPIHKIKSVFKICTNV